MSKMSAELEKRLDANKYEMYDGLTNILPFLEGFLANVNRPELPTFQVHPSLLNIVKRQTERIKKVINAIEKG